MKLADVALLPPPRPAYFPDYACEACERVGPWHSSPFCPECDDLAPDALKARVAAVNGRKEAARLEARRVRRMTAAGLPARFQKVPPTKGTISGGEWVLVHGGTGTGKTYRAAAILSRWLEDGHDGVFLSWPDFLASRRQGFRTDDEDHLIRAKSAGLLVLDDVGAEKPSEWTIETAFVLLDHRYAWLRPTVLTTNLPPERLGEWVGERAMSRLLQTATIVRMDGEDRRIA